MESKLEDTYHHVTLLPAEMLENSPSKRDGIDADVEMAHRIWGCALIQEAGILLRLPQVVMCTAQNLFHRFYYRKSLARFDTFLVAMGTFFLACKVEEKPKRIREVLFVFHYVYRLRARKAGASLELGGVRYNGWKDALVKMERHVLKELGFSFNVRTPEAVVVNALGKNEAYQVLNVLEFNSTRKRMSVIVRSPAGARWP